jgi:hypothetical protein
MTWPPPPKKNFWIRHCLKLISWTELEEKQLYHLSHCRSLILIPILNPGSGPEGAVCADV